MVLNEWGEIIAGAGVVDNDFHDRVDLTPNVCALFVEKDYRNQRIAKMILETIKQDFAEMGVKVLYLVTDHTDFYENTIGSLSGWLRIMKEFLCECTK
mgnify:CR=1 FL=1